MLHLYFFLGAIMRITVLIKYQAKQLKKQLPLLITIRGFGFDTFVWQPYYLNYASAWVKPSDTNASKLVNEDCQTINGIINDHVLIRFKMIAWLVSGILTNT